MPPDQRPSYPRTPAYGEGVRPRAADPRPGSTEVPAGPPVRPRGVPLTLALSVLVNLVTLVGVLALHWPAGNVFALFWCENVVLGVVTLVRVTTAEREPQGRVGTALFFCVHYGIFCVVHLVFTGFVAAALGVDLSFRYLGLPVVLLLVRYGVELGTTWFGPEGLRRRVSPRTAMFAPYPRVAVLQVGVLVAFALVLVGFVTDVPGSSTDALHRTLALLPTWLGRPAVLAVVVLLGVKTVVDVLTTRRALLLKPHER